MCGIWGSIAKKGHKVDLKKMEILGLWNERRGPDSCGYYYAGNIQKGVDFYKLVGDFFIKQPFKHGDQDCEVFMGHARKSTVGASNEKNAHPHTCDDYVQTHNGTIKNIWTLCNKYDVDAKGIDVDSAALAHIIKHRGLDVLNHYKGYAALTMTYLTDPNVLYLYHGASREDDKDEKPKEERPLFILDTPEALYYSSIYNSLVHISTGEDKPEVLPHNKVFKVEHGILQQEPIYIVQRDDVNKTSDYKMNTFFDAYVYDKTTNMWLPAPVKELPPVTLPHIKPKGTDAPIVAIGDHRYEPTNSEVASGKVILREDYPPESYTTDVYYRFGRFYRGYNILLHGVYDIDRDGLIISNNGTIKFKSNRVTDTYYFVRGVMMTDKAAFDKFKTMYITLDINKAFAFVASEYSRYPIMNLPSEGTVLTDTYKYVWWRNKKKYSGAVQVKFSERIYHIKNGLFKFIETHVVAEKLLVDDVYSISPSFLDDGYDNFPDVIPALTPTCLHEDLDAISRNNIVDMVYLWCDKIIKKGDVTTIPEQFLIFLDFLVEQIADQANPFIEVNKSNAEIEHETMQQLNSLITAGMSLKDSMRNSECAGMVSPAYIRKCMVDYDINDLLQVENRYLYTPFDYGDEEENPIKNDPNVQLDIWKKEVMATDEAEEFKEQYHALVDQLVQLEKLADNMQTLESNDAAQDSCHGVYAAINVIKQRLQTVTQSDRYRELSSKLEKIKSC